MGTQCSGHGTAWGHRIHDCWCLLERRRRRRKSWRAVPDTCSAPSLGARGQAAEVASPVLPEVARARAGGTSRGCCWVPGGSGQVLGNQPLPSAWAQFPAPASFPRKNPGRVGTTPFPAPVPPQGSRRVLGWVWGPPGTAAALSIFGRGGDGPAAAQLLRQPPAPLPRALQHQPRAMPLCWGAN